MPVNLGFQSGLKLGAAINNLLFANHGMVIAHRIKGRRRYICLALKGNEAACKDVERLLRHFPGITKAAVSPITGSVIVNYTQKEKVINILFDALSHEIAGKHAVQEETIIPTGALTVGDNINDTLVRAKAMISKFFNHTEPAFFTRIAGMALLIYGINRVVFNGDRPAGPQLLLWGLAMLMRRSHPEAKLSNDADLDSGIIGNKQL